MNTQYESIQRYRRWYAKLLRLYSRPYRERFGEEMEQTFNDLLCERAEEERGLFGYVFWMFIETSAEIAREKIRVTIMQSKNMIGIALTTVLILLVPLVAMQITDEIVWDLVDFAVAGVLLFGAGLTYDLVARKWDSIIRRAAVGTAVVATLLLIWTNLAVGMIGSEENPANLMYGGVLATGIIGSMLARFRSHGMARVLFAMALAQAFIALIVLAAGLGYPGTGPLEVVLLNGFFMALFVGSALLFRRAKDYEFEAESTA